MLANIRPVDERECSRVLAEATATHTPVAVIGSGSKQQIGRPMNTAANVSTKGLRGITRIAVSPDGRWIAIVGA